MPDHSRLTRIRERYGLQVFRRLFEAIVEQCLQAGLVCGRELYFDATKVEANASLDSVAPRFAVEAHLGTLFASAEAEGPGDADEGEDGDGPARLPVALTAEARAAFAEAAAHRHDWIGEAGHPNRSVVRGDYHRTAYFGRDRFTYEAERDVYRCLGGQELRFREHKYTERTRVYQAPAAACNACPLKTQCTTSANGRQLTCSFDEAYLEQVGGYHATEAYKKEMRRRQSWAEPLFAEAKAWHGLGRFRFRGLGRVNGEALLIAAGQNQKRLLSRCGWGRRPFPSGAAAPSRL